MARPALRTRLFVCIGIHLVYQGWNQVVGYDMPLWKLGDLWQLPVLSRNGMLNMLIKMGVLDKRVTYTHKG